MPRHWADAGRSRWLALAAVLALVVLGWAVHRGAVAAGGHEAAQDPADLPRVAVADLPPEAAHTIALIEAGGPFPYDRDGIVFENREGLLPDESSGYYHEYTVPTPGAADRGARRVISGSGGELYWTGDHYRTFERISP